ncbi:MAG: CYTH domain-containing protein [Prevotella sp.]|nr:CYTH domain-containing protein [Prevotella sp.]
MAGMEIERKFLVLDQSFKHEAYAHSSIKQGYICSERGRTVRVRRRDDKAYLTIKGPSLDGGLSRYEFEKEITTEEAEQLFCLCEPGVVEKTRWLVKSGAHTFEVDEFSGDNAGLIMAEVELGSADEAFVKPAFIGDEVTGDRRYYNSSLRAHPYKEWHHRPLSKGERARTNTHSC